MLLRFGLFYMVNIIAPRLRASLWSWIFGPWVTSEQVGQEAGVGWVDVQGGFSCVEDNIYVRYRLITNWTWFLLCNPCYSSRADWNLTHGYMHKHTHMVRELRPVQDCSQLWGELRTKMKISFSFDNEDFPGLYSGKKDMVLPSDTHISLVLESIHELSYTHSNVSFSFFSRLLCGFPNTCGLPNLRDEVFILFYVQINDFVFYKAVNEMHLIVVVNKYTRFYEVYVSMNNKIRKVWFCFGTKTWIWNESA